MSRMPFTPEPAPEGEVYETPLFERQALWAHVDTMPPTSAQAAANTAAWMAKERVKADALFSEAASLPDSNALRLAHNAAIRAAADALFLEALPRDDA